jgi:hypothetical protein
MGFVRSVFAWYVPEGDRAGACVQCRTCEEKCPQKIEISAWMSEVHAVLGEGKPYKM